MLRVHSRAAILLLLLSSAAVLVIPSFGCASFEFVQPPARGADVYPHAEVRSGVVVAVDEITEPDRVRNYFGADLLDEGILPVQVVVSNRTNGRVVVKPSDVLLLEGRKIVDPMPLERVVAIPKSRGLFLGDSTEEQIDAFFAGISFREVVLAPGESHHGMLFFKREKRRSKHSRFFRIVSLYAEPTLRLRLVATDLEKDRRIGFGPFGVYR